MDLDASTPVPRIGGVASMLSGVLMTAWFALHPAGEDATFGTDPRWVPVHALLWAAFTVALRAWVAVGPPDNHVPAATATLSVTVTGFKNTKGRAIVALYADASSWLHDERAARLQTVAIDSATLTVRFAGLPPGTYAASAIHDENGNGKLDMRYFPIPRPREGAGVSNNVRPRFGPPSWSDARFALGDSASAITIALRY